MRGSRKFSQGGGGGPNSQKGSDINFNMAKTYNLAIPGVCVGGGTPCPLPPPSGSAHVWTVFQYYRNNLCKQVELMSELNCTEIVRFLAFIRKIEIEIIAAL